MKKYSRETTVGLFMVVGLVFVAYMAIKLGQVSLFGEDAYMINARFQKVTGLRTGNPVTMFGLRIGTVTALEIDQENQMAVVRMTIKNGIRIYGDAIAAIKTEGLIGDKYVDIDAGGGLDPITPGGTIVDTVSPVDVGDIIGKYAFGSVDKK
ncbi:MAG: outer membrane lipid asymmetry maintenance protein MlaD [Desulfobacteraceae bacterium]